MRARAEEVVDALWVGADELLVEGASRQGGPVALEIGREAGRDNGGRIRRARGGQHE